MAWCQGSGGGGGAETPLPSRGGQRSHLCGDSRRGINHDGKTNGITAPNGVVQAQLYRSVYDQYGIHPESLSYVVTHGTGTRLGDPVEINGLRDAFRSYTDKEGFVRLPPQNQLWAYLCRFRPGQSHQYGAGHAP